MTVHQDRRGGRTTAGLEPEALEHRGHLAHRHLIVAVEQQLGGMLGDPSQQGPGHLGIDLAQATHAEEHQAVAPARTPQALVVEDVPDHEVAGLIREQPAGVLDAGGTASTPNGTSSGAISARSSRSSAPFPQPRSATAGSVPPGACAATASTRRWASSIARRDENPLSVWYQPGWLSTGPIGLASPARYAMVRPNGT